MEDIIRSIRENRKSVCNTIWNNFCSESPEPPSSVKIISYNGIRCNRNVSRVNVAQDPLLQSCAFQNYSGIDKPKVSGANEVLPGTVTGAGDTVLPQKRVQLPQHPQSSAIGGKSHVTHFVPNSRTIPPRIERDLQTKTKEHASLFDDPDDAADQNLHTFDSHDPETVIDGESDSEELEEFIRLEAAQEAVHTSKATQIIEAKTVKRKDERSQVRAASQESKMKKMEDVKTQEEIKKDNDAEFAMMMLNKITQLQERILMIILDLRITIEEAPLIDDPLEMTKRRKRGLEFSIRFARNHLYQIGRLTLDVQRSVSTSDVLNKTLALHSFLVQAIQTYQKSIGGFIMNKNPEKLIGEMLIYIQ